MTTSNYFYKTKFDIHPSEGVGFLILKLLNENNMDSNIRFVYDDKLTNKMPITLQLKTNMLDLTFDSNYQKLILIELKSWNEFTSFYHNNLPLINESPASSSSVTTTSPSTTITTTTTTNISTNTTPLITTSISPSSSQSSNTTSTNTTTNISTNTTVTSDNSYLNSNSNTNSNTNSHLQPNFKSLYNKIFGPTYPGYYDTLTKSYLLSYPDIQQ
ncbi:unnamed protein product [[Candida] boidinii]|uniref:Unnamed protein product n=1 Tax=Candida boidinii TaxID=5477 RepID=A0ACB5U077_CANBO|nr:unnamed protein product [[Candida] boidinii]